MKKIIGLLLLQVCLIFTSCKKEILVPISVPPQIPYYNYGTIQFWTSIELGYFSNNSAMYVTINNQTKTFQHYWDKPGPARCDTRNINGQFDLPPGTYSWKANCAYDSTSGTIIIKGNACVLQELF